MRITMLIDQTVLRARLNHILLLQHGNHRNAGMLQVPGRPPPLLLQTGRRVVLGLLRLGLGIAGPLVLGPATERDPPRMTLMSCDSMQHTLHLSHALAWFRMLWISLAHLAAPHLLPPFCFLLTPLPRPLHLNTSLHFFDDTTSVFSHLLASVATVAVSLCPHLSALSALVCT